MREFGKVSPQFWVGETGKSIRGDFEAQIVALYLMTSPHSRAIGIFYCPVHYMAHETGLTIEGAWKGLRRLIEAEFCEYDEASETVFVVKMAAHQIGDDLKPTDKRLIGVQKEVRNLPESRLKSSFLRVYGVAFSLVEAGKKTKGHRRGIEAPSKLKQGEGEGEGEEKTSSDDKSTDGFARFWESWPKSQRKVAKAECVKLWTRYGLEPKADEVVAHVEAMKACKQWRDGYDPAPATYLRQRRWEDGIVADSDAKPVRSSVLDDPRFAGAL